MWYVAKEFFGLTTFTCYGIASYFYISIGQLVTSTSYFTMGIAIKLISYWYIRIVVRSCQPTFVLLRVRLYDSSEVTCIFIITGVFKKRILLFCNHNLFL